MFGKCRVMISTVVSLEPLSTTTILEGTVLSSIDSRHERITLSELYVTTIEHIEVGSFDVLLNAHAI